MMVLNYIKIPGFKFVAVDSSNIYGKLKVRQRENGNFLMTANLVGLTGSQSLKLGYFRGSYESGNFKFNKSLGNYTVSNVDGITFGFPLDAKTMSAFDTLQGFLGLEAENSTPDTLRFVSICNFGGNKSSGNEITYPIYSRNDSVLVGRVLFQEIGAVGSPLRVTFTPVLFPNTNDHYLSLHKGTYLDAIDPVFFKKVSNSAPTVFQSIPDGNGGLMTYDKILNFNGNIRMVEDTLGFGNVSGEADLGGNIVEKTDSIVVKLDQISPESPNSGGTLIYRPRKNGKVVLFYRLQEGSLNGAGADNLIEIKEGSIPVSFDPYAVSGSRFKIKFIGGSPGEPVKNVLDLQNSSDQPATWTELKTLKNQGGAFVEWNFTEDVYAYPISRGNF